MKSWVINGMECKIAEGNLQDVVIIVFWTRLAVEQNGGKEYSASVYGSYGVPAPNPNDFTPYPNLSKQQVDGWLDAGLDVTALDASLDSNIQSQINPTTEQLPLPWAS
jgi:hypothetical protein